MSADVRVIEGDCLQVLPTLEGGSVDCVVTDPPYELDFMAKAWDRTGVAFNPETWSAVLRVVKPGGYMLATGGTRTYHRMACAIEDAGWEIRDCLMWLYGTGFPKGQGCLKPAYEPIILARRPGPKVLPLGIDECRVPVGKDDDPRLGGNGTWATAVPQTIYGGGKGIPRGEVGSSPLGRYPANVLHDGSPEVLEAFAAFGESRSPTLPFTQGQRKKGGGWDRPCNETHEGEGIGYGDTGSAARFFFCSKASTAERNGSTHPTMKPLALVRWMVRLICPPGGLILDPFAGSGTSGLAAIRENRRAVLIERHGPYCAIIRKRLADADGPLFAQEDA